MHPLASSKGGSYSIKKSLLCSGKKLNNMRPVDGEGLCEGNRKPFCAVPTVSLRYQSVTSRLETSRYRDFSQFFESIGLGLENFGLEKKSRYRSRKYLVSKKSLGIGLENIWSRKKVSVSVSKTLVSKKVSVSVSKILVSKKSQ